MNSIFTLKNIRIVIIVLIVAIMGLIGFYGYNEYTYQKITSCVVEGNYSLAENYIDSVSPNYRDLRKIKNLILTIQNLETEYIDNKERAYSRLESLKGFEDEDVNQFYNSLLFSLYKEIELNNLNQTVYEFIPSTTLSIVNSEETTPFTVTETAETIISSEITTVTNETTIQTTTTAATFTTEPIIAATTTTEPITTYVQTTTTQQYVPPTTKIVTTTQAPTTKTTTLPYYSTGTVYYVESGEVYHINPDCRTLSRSTNIFSGPIPEGRRACKVCSQ